MNDVKKLLVEEAVVEANSLDELPFGSEEYKHAAETMCKVVDKIIDIERIEAESRDKEEARKLEKELKEAQMKEERTDRIIKNTIAVGTLLVTAAGVIWMPKWGTEKILKFEETGTVTTIPGRAWVSNIFKFKK